ncbi:MAG TPA: family 20 glycosylhydrolase [bacterium]|uniref:Glycosyl hydrolase family 20, catalytic domain n=1 Tax=candidate division TA06 bacterium ADurb.Bin417 TaxID=1852828 RepID=A0A1V5MGT7_UNCT6|nr:MAG: Glycosyl hydrolase family 20, catalytic domain [candidate division TA06 bacterium ADurb.Bin417]HNQ35629.1 family 20 glycosylhydrolase [bacterium]HNS49043.1 family 20 glycosylhydrolase [bacterium]
MLRDKILGFQFDLKRAMWREAYFDRMAEILAGWGFNQVLYEFEDKLRFRKHPCLAHPDAWSPEATAALVRRLEGRGLEVVPLFQSLGHAESVLRLPEYAHLRQSPEHLNLYDPVSEAARDFLKEIFAETIEVFQPRRFFHVGGDETRNLGAAGRAAGREPGGLYLGHLRPLWEYLLGRGLRPVVWADMLLTYLDVLEQTPAGVVLMDWDYSTGGERWPRLRRWGVGELDWEAYRSREDPEFKSRFEKYFVDERTPADGLFRGFGYVDALVDRGFNVIAASSSRCWGDSAGLPFNQLHLANVFYSARKGRAVGLGTLVTSWAARRHHPELGLPAAFAAAYAGRREGPFDLAAFSREFTAEFYGAAAPEFGRAMELAGVRPSLSESRHLELAAGLLAEGRDPLEVFFPGEKHSELAGRAATARTSLREAREIISGLRDRARRNADNLDFWLEGIDLVAFYADFAAAVLSGRLAAESGRLREDLNRLRLVTRDLFGRTYEAAGLEAELDLRYGVHEALLGKLPAPR